MNMEIILTIYVGTLFILAVAIYYIKDITEFEIYILNKKLKELEERLDKKDIESMRVSNHFTKAFNLLEDHLKIEINDGLHIIKK